MVKYTENVTNDFRFCSRISQSSLIVASTVMKIHVCHKDYCLTQTNDKFISHVCTSSRAVELKYSSWNKIRNKRCTSDLSERIRIKKLVAKRCIYI